MASGASDNMNSLAFVGFGEAASAIVEGWRDTVAARIQAFDIKTDDADSAIRDGKWADYSTSGVTGNAALGEALAGIDLVFSTVTADQALVAARQAAEAIAPGALFLDCNSCAPGTKQTAAEAIEAAGGRYVDVAIMAPIRPTLHKTPLLISGPRAQAAYDAVTALDMKAEIAGEILGQASSIKMMRSVAIKGIEAVAAECVLSARRAGVDDVVLASLDKTFPGFDWKRRAGYMLERATTHGVRRAAEMREVAITVEQLGFDAGMSHATVDWQQRLGDLGIKTDSGDAERDYGKLADRILARLDGAEDEEE